MNEKIAELSNRITADVSMLDGVTVDLREVDPGDLRPDNDEGDLPHTRQSPKIAISIEGKLRIALEFFEYSGYSEDDRGFSLHDQFLEALNQLQDVIVEHFHKAWPVCLEHPHVLVLESDGQDLVWRCPDDSNIEVPFGSLSRSSG